MITYSIIQKSRLEGAHRIDAEYYQPEYLHLDNILRRSRVNKIIDLSIFVKKGIFDLSPDNYQAEGIPFIRVQNIRNGFVDTESLVFISEESHRIEKKTELTSFDLVLSKVGTIGEISIIPSYFPKANFSQNVIGIKIDKDKIHAGFLLAYLLSKLGQLQIARVQMFSVQSKLELQDIRDLKVIRFGKAEEEINQTIIMVEELFNNAKSLYSQAEDVLLQELGLKNFKAEESLSFVVNLSDVKVNNRLDSDYYQPKYGKLLQKIGRCKCEKLGNITKRVKTKIKPDPQKFYKYIEISDVNVSNGDVNSNEIIGVGLPPNARIQIKGGELIVSKVRPTRKAIAILPVDFSRNFICSSAFSVFNADDILKAYLFIVLRSVIGNLQFEKPTTGTEYPTITDEDVENIIIPILSKPIQQKIADLVRKSHEARQKAKALLEEAKQKVEDMISGK